VILSSNTASDAGGALFSESSITFNNSVYIIGNSVAGDDGAETYSGGGAIWSAGDISFDNVSGNAQTVISANTMTSGDGGAIYSSSGTVVFQTFVSADNNQTLLYGNGGAIYASGIVIANGANFSSNTANGYGGAIYIRGVDSVKTSSISAITRDVLFTNNIAQNGNDIYIDGNQSSHALVLIASQSRTITFDSGITVTGTGSSVDFISQDETGTLVFNGSFELQNFKTTNGLLKFGANSSFKADGNVSFTNTFIDMRNENNSDELKASSLNISSSTIYYDFNLDKKISDKITLLNNAVINNAIIKVGLAGIASSEIPFNIISSTYNIIPSPNSSGIISVDKTNSEGKNMTRLKKADIVYNSGDPESWNNANIIIYVEQLNAISNLTDNEKQMAVLLDKIYGTITGKLFDGIDEIDRMLSAEEKKKALNALSGNIYANAVTLPAFNIAKNNILSRLARNNFSDEDKEYKRSIWAQQYNADNLYKGDKYSPGDFKALNNGIVAGFDTLRNDEQIFGITFGVINTIATQNNDSIDMEGYTIGGYAAFFFDNNSALTFMAIGGQQNYTAQRKITLIDISDNIVSDFTGYSISLSAEFSKGYQRGKNIFVKPFIGLDYACVYTNKFIERGSELFDITVLPNSYNRAVGNIGFQINNGYASKFRCYIQAQADLLFIGQYGEFEGEIKNGENSLGYIKIRGVENDMANAVFGAGALYNIANFLSIYINVNALYSNTQTGYYGNVGLNIKFSTTPKDFYATN
jgi:predicted outer membrane repeat protein